MDQREKLSQPKPFCSHTPLHYPEDCGLGMLQVTKQGIVQLQEFYPSLTCHKTELECAKTRAQELHPLPRPGLKQSSKPKAAAEINPKIPPSPSFYQDHLPRKDRTPRVPQPWANFLLPRAAPARNPKNPGSQTEPAAAPRGK